MEFSRCQHAHVCRASDNARWSSVSSMPRRRMSSCNDRDGAFGNILRASTSVSVSETSGGGHPYLRDSMANMLMSKATL